MNDVTTLSDSALDAAYAACFDNRDFNAANIYGFEIVNRLTTAFSFLGGIVGFTRFPKYDARQTAKARADAGLSGTGFQQSDAARTSIADSSASVGNKIADIAKIGSVGVLFFGAIALGVFVYLQKK